MKCVVRRNKLLMMTGTRNSCRHPPQVQRSRIGIWLILSIIMSLPFFFAIFFVMCPFVLVFSCCRVVYREFSRAEQHDTLDPHVSYCLAKQFKLPTLFFAPYPSLFHLLLLYFLCPIHRCCIDYRALGLTPLRQRPARQSAI